MQRFIYKAKTKEGNDQKGRVEARDMASAVNVLREKGWVVVSMQPLNEADSMASIKKFFQKVKVDDVVAFTRQLSTMISSGLPLTDALNVLEVQSEPAMTRVIGDILRDVQGGSTIGDALSKHDKVFSPVYVSLVRAGEAAGVLDDVLKRLASNLEKQKEFRAKTKGALVYPIIVVFGMLMVTVVMMVFVVPKLSAMYEDFGADLPFATRVLIGASDFMTGYWYVMLGMVAGLFFMFRSWVKTEAGSLTYDQILLKMPVFGKLRSQIDLAEVARTLSLLLGAGISLLEALEIVKNSVDNIVFRIAIENIIEGVKKGVPFSISLTKEGVFPPLLSNMTSVGEETGKMDEVLLKVSSYFEDEAEHTIKGLTTALEPLIMIVLGVGVGFLVIAIVMPIYNLANQF